MSGCASVGDSFASTAFADPAKYVLYDCKKLEVERKSLAARTTDLQKLLDKAATGTGGTIAGELAYRNDYIAVRAQLKNADAAWANNRCDAPAPAARPAIDAAAGVAPASPVAPGETSARSIY